jgi:hypothetical protein
MRIVPANSGVYGYSAHFTRFCTHSEREPEAYGSWSEEYDVDFDGIEKTKEYPDIVSVHNLKRGDMCYVVWALWSTGDSFGCSRNGEYEALALFIDNAAAEDFRNQLIKSDNGSYEYSTVIKCLDGQELTVNKGWTGYFESLSDINIEYTELR